MPNHIQNRLTINGTTEQIEEVKKSLQVEEDGKVIPMDFNKILAMPEGLKMECHSGVETACKVALHIKTFTTGREKSPIEFEDNDWEQFIQGLQNARKTGFVYWYDWACENWGTKWNAYHQPDNRDTDNIIHFQTAWSAPTELMGKLSAKFPLVEFVLQYADEDTGCNVGVVTYREGAIVSQNIPQKTSNEAYEMAFELWPEDKANYSLVDGKYKYTEED